MDRIYDMNTITDNISYETYGIATEHNISHDNNWQSIYYMISIKYNIAYDHNQVEYFLWSQLIILNMDEYISYDP